MKGKTLTMFRCTQKHVQTTVHVTLSSHS